jgi:lon-related putative ATP-dependent protease
MAVTPLKLSQLRKNISLNLFRFKTTESIPSLDSIIGQDRAIRAIELALEMEHSGYNVFVTGMSGTGRTTIVRDILTNIANDQAVPDDWIYVYNFQAPDIPNAICLPAGKGKVFQSDMEELIETLKKEIPASFDSEEYEKQNASILMKNTEKKRQIMNELDAEARSLNIQIQSTPAGFQTVVLRDDKPLGTEDYEALTAKQKKEIDKNLANVQEKINTVVREIVRLDRDTQQSIRTLNENIAGYIVTRYVYELRSKYEDQPEIVTYLDDISQEIISSITEFLSHTRKESEKDGDSTSPEDHFKRFEVNIFVDNSATKGAPVIYEANPTYNNLFGRIDKKIIMGAQVTDFTMLKPGSLHRANGGYLMTEAYHVLTNPYVYDALKRVIKTKEIRTEDVSELYGYLSAAGIRPEPIPLNLKVILIGWNEVYYMLQAYDKDFNKIFKIRADFDYETDATQESIHKYAQFIGKVCQEENLQPFDRSAVREIIYFGNRLVDDQEKISLRFGSLVGIIREANHYAKKDKASLVVDRHVKQAILESEYRQSMIEDKYQEIYDRNIYKIDVVGEKVGEINGLSVSSIGEYSFGRPSKITAKTFIGNENVVNIERKARLSGKFHDKGLLILSGFFNSKFGQFIPPSFSASITFEQSYSMIDGDSASSTELYALLSSLSNVPIKQGIAVTGSVNQNGEVQAIGGVNEKIEGYFQVCQNKGLTGQQGVIIPRSNVDNLMLKDEVRSAVKEKKFNIWAVDTIEDGLKILTGQQTGARQKSGKFTKNTLFWRVEKQLATYAQRASDFKKSIGEKKNSKNNDKGDGDQPENGEDE